MKKSLQNQLPTLLFFAATVIFVLHKNKDAILKTLMSSGVQATNPPGSELRLVTPEELATKTAQHDDGKTLWLAILGEVFDVSKGSEHYAEGGYSIFTGRDASVAFVSGVFTAEEATKSVASLEPKQILGIADWLEFYKTEEKYPQIGWLVGYLYDEEGNPSDVLKDIRVKVAEERIASQDREKERKEKIKERRRKKEAERLEKERKLKWEKEQAEKARQSKPSEL